MQIARGYKILIVCITLTILLILSFTIVFGDNYNVTFTSLGFMNLMDVDEDIGETSSESNKTPSESNKTFTNKLKPPTRGQNNIIFLETSCVVNELAYTNIKPKLLLNPQQACAIESAARTNPDASIHLFYTCPLDDISISRSSELVRQLFEYPNVNAWHQNMTSFFDDTPLQEFYKSGRMQKSRYPESHSSDVLRFLVLWKFGGIYLDLDFIVLRSLSTFSANFACAECCDYVASGAMSFSAEGIGKKIADQCVEELRLNFDGEQWSNNGPGLITRVLKKHCGLNKTLEMTREQCEGFAVLPSVVFYPIMYGWKLFYNETLSESTMTQVMKGHAVHLWNSLMGWEGGGHMHMGSRQPIVLLQQEFCPVVYSHLSMDTADTQTKA